MQHARATTLPGVLIASGKVTEDILKTVIHEEGLPPFKACQRLIDMGFIAEEEMLKIFSSYFEYPYVSLKNFQPKDLFIEGLSENFMREAKCVPIEMNDARMKVAINNPFDWPALDAVKMVTGRAIDVCLAKDAEISDAIEKIFSTGASAMDRLIESTGGSEGDGFSMDEDGDVDYDDYVIILHAFGHSVGQPEYVAEADYDDDGAVSLIDYRTWFNCYRNFIGNPNAPVPTPPPPPPGGSPLPVPAPKPIPLIQPISPTAEISKSPVREPTQ